MNILTDVLSSLLPEIIALGVDVALFGICSKFYRDELHHLNLLKRAPEVNLDVHLKNQLLQHGSIPYAVVRAPVNAMGTPIHSQYVPEVVGVVQELRVIECRVRWNSFSRLWLESENVVQYASHVIPFCLGNKKIFDQTTVEVLQPELAKELFISTIYADYAPDNGSFAGHLSGWFRGEHIKGHKITEKLLVEGSLLTGVGQLIVQNNQVKLKPSPSGYYLTTLTKDALVHKLEDHVDFYAAFSVFFAAVGIFIFVHIAKSVYEERNRRGRARAEQARREEVKAHRRKMAREHSSGGGSSTAPTCVVCLTNPVEVLLMDCGHVSLCLDCSENLTACPVCRSTIVRTVAAFLS